MNFSKHILLLLWVAGVSNLAYTQKKIRRFETETFNTSGFKLFPLEIDIKKSKIVPVNFASVSILDKRADISKLGLVRTSTKNEDYHRFVFEGEGLEYLTKKMNRLFKPDSGSTASLVLHLNNLWLYQTMEASSLMKKELIGTDNYVSNCYINCDVFVQQQDKLNPIGNIDTIVSVNGWIANNCNQVLRKGLVATLDMCDSLLAQPQPFSPLFYNDFADIPLLREEPRKGIFVTYEEFLLNKPSITGFAVEATAVRRFLHTSQLPDSLAAKCWGYSDETGLYMNINQDFYKLNRSQNTFDLQAPLIVEIKNSATKKSLLLLKNVLLSTTSFMSAYPFYYVDVSPLILPTWQHTYKLLYFQLNIRDGTLK